MALAARHPVQWPCPLGKAQWNRTCNKTADSVTPCNGLATCTTAFYDRRPLLESSPLASQPRERQEAIRASRQREPNGQPYCLSIYFTIRYVLHPHLGHLALPLLLTEVSRFIVDFGVWNELYCEAQVCLLYLVLLHTV